MRWKGFLLWCFCELHHLSVPSAIKNSPSAPQSNTASFPANSDRGGVAKSGNYSAESERAIVCETYFLWVWLTKLKDVHFNYYMYIFCTETAGLRGTAFTWADGARPAESGWCCPSPGWAGTLRHALHGDVWSLPRSLWEMKITLVSWSLIPQYFRNEQPVNKRGKLANFSRL